MTAVGASRRGAGAATRRAAAQPVRRRSPTVDRRGRPEPGLRLVEDRAPVRRRLSVVGVGIVLFAFGVLFALAVFHSVLVQAQLRIDRTQALIQQEEARHRLLRLEVGRLASPDRITAEASAMGMVHPTDRIYLASVIPGSVVPPPEEPQTGGRR